MSVVLAYPCFVFPSPLTSITSAFSSKLPSLHYYVSLSELLWHCGGVWWLLCLPRGLQHTGISVGCLPLPHLPQSWELLRCSSALWSQTGKASRYAGQRPQWSSASSDRQSPHVGSHLGKGARTSMKEYGMCLLLIHHPTCKSTGIFL